MPLINPLFDEVASKETASRDKEEAFTLNIPCWAGPPGEPPIPVLFEVSTRTVVPDIRKF